MTILVNLNILSPQILTCPILRRLHIRVTTLGAAAILELDHLWVHACRPLAGDPSPRIIVVPFRGDDLVRGAALLNPVHQGQHGIVFGVGETRHRMWDGTFEGCLLVGAGEVPRSIVGFWSALTVSDDVMVRGGQLDSAEGVFVTYNIPGMKKRRAWSLTSKPRGIRVCTIWL